MAKAWKRAAVAALGVLVIGGGINAAMAAGRDDPRPTTSVQKVADDRGREQEARGRVAEGENEVRGRENELRGRENEPEHGNTQESETTLHVKNLPAETASFVDLAQVFG